eukprot:TRINITY_DN13957_c0_g1_i1.p2 TRINITY_DN13957_c0_g1~~TRINITY_DN13957_c0_g1_i1.p2  ORF type:complete len:182 (-),score=54.50 TRINITY_DN13957_c0_g1_i1:126-671(-)
MTALAAAGSTSTAQPPHWAPAAAPTWSSTRCGGNGSNTSAPPPCKRRKSLSPAVPDISFPITPGEVFDLLRDIRDPQFASPLEVLGIVRPELIEIATQGPAGGCVVRIGVVPQSLGALVGLCVRKLLERDLPRRCKVDITVHPQCSPDAQEITKQLNDKERVNAALEHPLLRQAVAHLINS